jgi:hypothetical protein
MRNAFAHLFDDACAFVSKHDRKRHTVAIQILYGQIGMAHATSDNPNEDFVESRIIDCDIANHGGSSGLF